MAKGFRRRGYHHGSLREALIAAARQLVAERGPLGFTIAEAARSVGVSAAAPYRHFKDRDALLAEVAERGFAEFERRLSAAWRGAVSDPGAAFLRMGEAYLAFARDEPGYYGAMFIARPRPAGRRRARDKQSLGVLETALAQLTTGADLDPRLLAYQVWALSHGIATLAAARQLPSAARLQPLLLLREGVGALIRGAVGKPPGRRAVKAAARQPQRAAAKTAGRSAGPRRRKP